MGDCEESEDANSSIGDEERVRRLFQACDGDGDGFIDSQDLLNMCRELNFEESVEALMRELGADEHGRISYREFLRRRVALRPEIDAIKASQPPQPEYLPTSSENSNSLGEGKLSWEFDSGARDLSPEPTQQAASGNLLELANKLHVAALASLKAEILDLTNRLEVATQERDHYEKLSLKAEADRRRIELRMLEDAELHEEQLTELHSVIAELTRKHAQQRTLVIQEEPSEGEAEPEEILEQDEVEETSDVSSVSPEPDAEPDGPDLEQQLNESRAENALLQQRLDRALQDLEAISQINAKKSRECSECCQPYEEPIRISHARVSSPACVLDRTSNMERPTKSTSSPRPVSPRMDRSQARMAERVRLRKVADFTALGAQVLESLTGQTFDGDDGLKTALDQARADNTVLAITLEETRGSLERLTLLLGKYESNAVALSQALTHSDAALQVAESLIGIMVPGSQQEERCSRLRSRLSSIKSQRDQVATTVVKLESYNVEPLPSALPTSAHNPRKLDLETAVLMQELMRMREERLELKARQQRFEKDRASQTAQLHTALQIARTMQQGENSTAMVAALERLAGPPVTPPSLPENSAILAATLERCKRKYQARLRRLEAQMAALVARHADQVRVLHERIAVLEEPPIQETNI